MRYNIGSEGPHTATLAIVAEKPAKDEIRDNRLLTGASGYEVNKLLSDLGSHRSQVYLTNAVRHFDSVGTPTDEDIQRDQPELLQDLSSLPNLNCIVAMGKAALLSLTNFHRDEITSVRGSILESVIGTKLIPTFHPSHYMHGEWRFRPVVKFDLNRALQQSQFKDIHRPQRTYYIEPDYNEALDWLHSLLGAPQITFDIECFYPKFIDCIGFAVSSKEAFNIPFMRRDNSSYWPVEQELELWRLIQQVLSQPKTEYITQNGLFDCYRLWQHGIDTPYMAGGFDTMYAHRLIAADLPHKLEFLCSIYTEEPYYKDESGDWTIRDAKKRAPDRQRWIYNCKDCAVTHEVAQAEREDLVELKQYIYYKSKIQTQWDFCINTRQRGLKVDILALVQHRTRLAEELSQLRSKIKSDVGWIPNTKSYIDMGKLFTQIGVTAHLTTGGRPATSEEKLIHYAHYTHSDRARETLLDCIEITKRRTIQSSFLNIALDDRCRYHPSLDLSHAKSGRASSEGDEDGGPQIQNIPQSVRHLFIPYDSDSEITCADQEQAEARYVAYTADDPLLIQTFLQGKDVHRVRGCIIYRDWHTKDVPPDDLMASIREVCDICQKQGQTKCNHSERYMSKQSGHAFAYLEGVRRFMLEQTKKRIWIPEQEATRIRNLVVSQEIKAWQWRTEQALSKSPVLWNSFGRRREFYGQLDMRTVGAALSWLAQSHVSYITERATEFLEQNLPSGCFILTQTHDSVVISNKKSKRREVRLLLEEAFYHPAMIHNRELIIPIEITHGPNWGEQYKE